MVIDTSAIIAILNNEPEANNCCGAQPYNNMLLYQLLSVYQDDQHRQT